MPRIRSRSLHSIHHMLSGTVKSYQKRSDLGNYGLQFGIYHLAIIRDGEGIWAISRREDWYYQMFKQTMNTEMVFYNHQLVLSHFVSQHGKDKSDEAKLCALILQSEQLQNSSQKWLKQALEEYKNGELSVKQMFQIMTYLPIKRWFECVEILISIEIDLQSTNQNGRLGYVREVLHVLQQQEEQCDEYVPLQRIWWYALRICDLWEAVSIHEFLSVKQQQELCQDPAFFKAMQTCTLLSGIEKIESPQKTAISTFLADFFYRFLVSDKKGNLSMKDNLFDPMMLKDRSIEEIDDLLTWVQQTVTNDLKSQRPPQRGRRSEHQQRNLGHVQKMGIIHTWIFLSVGMYSLEHDEEDISEELWDYWKKLIPPNQSEENERRQRRALMMLRSTFLKVPLVVLEWMIHHLNSFGKDENINNRLIVILQKTHREAISKKNKDSIFTHLRDSTELEPFFSRWMDDVEVNGIEDNPKVIAMFQKKVLTTAQQDRLMDVLFPILEKTSTPQENPSDKSHRKNPKPQKDIFCYLYLMRENHSSTQQEKLNKYFDVYFDFSKLMLHKSDMDIRIGVFPILLLLIKQLSNAKRFEESIEMDEYMYKVIFHKKMDLHVTIAFNHTILLPLTWNDHELACQRVEKIKIPYGKTDAMFQKVQQDSNTILLHVMYRKPSWHQMTQVLQWRFFFEHPMKKRMNQIQSITKMLEKLAQANIVHMVPDFSVHLLDMFYSIPLVDRCPASKMLFPILPRDKPIESSLTYESPNTPKIEKRVTKLIEEAHDLYDFLLRGALVSSMVRLAWFFHVPVSPDVVSTYEKNRRKNKATDPATVRQYTQEELTEEVIDSLYQTSGADFIPYMHFKRMIEVIEDEKQPAVLKDSIQNRVCAAAILWANSLRTEDKQDEFNGLFLIYTLLVDWTHRQNLPSVQTQLEQGWNEWSSGVSYPVVFDCYIDFTLVKKRIITIPDAVRKEFRFHFFRDDSFVSKIQEAQKKRFISPAEVYVFILCQYDGDEEVVQRCMQHFATFSLQSIEKPIWKDDLIRVIPSKKELFSMVQTHLIHQKRDFELMEWICSFADPKATFASWIQQEKTIPKDTVASIYGEMIKKGIKTIDFFPLIVDHLYENMENVGLTTIIQKMKKDNYITWDNAETIANEYVFHQKNVFTELQQMLSTNIITAKEIAKDLFHHCMNTEHPVYNLREAILSGLLPLSEVLKYFTQNISNTPLEVIRRFSLIEPAKQDLHRDLVLYILMKHAKNDDKTEVQAIIDACPELLL